jgi:phage/plasmid-associated DNA primase
MIVRGVIGGSIASPSIKDLNGDFGLKHVFGKAALITDEAAQSSDIINENRFKVLVTGEPVDVAVKKQEAITGHQFHIPVVLIGNSLPKVTDETQALFNRSIVIRCARVFTAEEVVDLHKQLGVVGPSVGSWLAREYGSGILNLALDARDRLVRRGRYEITPLIAVAREAFRLDTSPVHGFLADATDREQTAESTRTDIYEAFRGYELEQGVKKRDMMSAKSFWNKVKNAAPYCNIDVRKSGKHRYVKGIRLNGEGERLKLLSDNEGS